MTAARDAKITGTCGHAVIDGIEELYLLRETGGKRHVEVVIYCPKCRHSALLKGHATRYVDRAHRYMEEML